jgi:hypothetical protein
VTPEEAWIRAQFPPDFQGHAVECGAWDGVDGYHTLSLEQEGWKVLCVEPNPACETSLRLNRQTYKMCAQPPPTAGTAHRSSTR